MWSHSFRKSYQFFTLTLSINYCSQNPWPVLLDFLSAVKQMDEKQLTVLAVSQNGPRLHFSQSFLQMTRIRTCFAPENGQQITPLENFFFTFFCFRKWLPTSFLFFHFRRTFFINLYGAKGAAPFRFFFYVLIKRTKQTFIQISLVSFLWVFYFYYYYSIFIVKHCLSLIFILILIHTGARVKGRV